MSTLQNKLSRSFFPGKASASKTWWSPTFLKILYHSMIFLENTDENRTSEIGKLNTSFQ